MNARDTLDAIRVLTTLYNSREIDLNRWSDGVETLLSQLDEADRPPWWDQPPSDLDYEYDVTHDPETEELTDDRPADPAG